MKWYRRFIEMSKQVATWSKDDTKVGAIIIDSDNRIVSSGFNGLPKGIPDTDEVYVEGCRIVLHAEVNAILFAKKDIAGCTMYVSMAPCAACAALIIQSGITTVVYPDKPLEGKWEAHQKTAESMFLQAGVNFIRLGE